MFNCMVTGKVSEPGEKLNRIVVKTRPRVYTRQERDLDTNSIVTVEIGRGSEIVREIWATEEGVLEWEAMTPAQREEHLRHL